VLACAAAMQAGSAHPLAHAVVQRAHRDGLALPQAHDVRAWPGRGIAAHVQGRELRLGSTRWMEELHVELGRTGPWAAELQEQGYTVSWLADVTASPRRWVALMAFGDSVKPQASDALQRLHAQGIRTAMLTGDHRVSAATLGRDLGVGAVHAEVLPEHKAELVVRMKASGARVAMVGDGINDAPALAAADVGIAMGGGTDAAMHAAGITLLRSDPALVVDAIAIARRTGAKIRQNLFWALVYNLVGIPLAALGLLNPVIAGAAMAFSSVSVVANALLLRRWQPGG
jgi:Cu+-exporting ATPase